jgi:hypothetical protein
VTLIICVFVQKFLASKGNSKAGEKPKTLAEKNAQVKKDVEGVTQVQSLFYSSFGMSSSAQQRIGV